MFTCSYCGFKSKSKIGFSAHLSRVEKLVGENLFIEKFKTYYPTADLEEIISGYIRDDADFRKMIALHKIKVSMLDPILILKGIKRTASESHTTTGYALRLQDGCLKSLGVKNVSQCATVKQKKKQTNLSRYGVLSNLQIPEVRIIAQRTWKNNAERNVQNIKDSIRKKYGVDNIAQTPSARKKNSISQKLRMSKLSDDERRAVTSAARKKLTENPTWISKIENRVFLLCKDIYPQTKQHVFLFRFNYDMMVGKTIIEVNGDFWHANPNKKYIRTDELLKGLTVGEVWDKDKTKKEKANKAGFKLITMWESDIIKMTDAEIVNFLKQEIEL